MEINKKENVSTSFSFVGSSNKNNTDIIDQFENEWKERRFFIFLLSVGNTENKTVGSLWPAAAMSCCWCVGLLLCPHRDGLPWFDALRNPFEWKKTNSDERSEETKEKTQRIQMKQNHNNNNNNNNNDKKEWNIKKIKDLHTHPSPLSRLNIIEKEG